MKTQINCGTQINSIYKEDTKNAVRKSRIFKTKNGSFYIWVLHKIQKTTKKHLSAFLVFKDMAFFTNSVTALKTVVTAIGAGVAVWGIINLLEGYGNDNPGAKSQGIKQLMAGGGIVIIAQTVIPQLSSLFS